MEWITDDLKAEIRKIFEPRYGHPLTNSEVIAIAENLTQLLEVFFQFKWRTEYGKK